MVDGRCGRGLPHWSPGLDQVFQLVPGEHRSRGGAGGGSRTLTSLAALRIFAPLRLSPPWPGAFTPGRVAGMLTSASRSALPGMMGLGVSLIRACLFAPAGNRRPVERADYRPGRSLFAVPGQRLPIPAIG